MAFRKRTNAYWEKRAQEQLTYVEQQSLAHLKAIDRVFRDAQKYTLQEVQKLYATYYQEQGFDTTALRQMAPNGDIRRFKQAVAVSGLASELPDGYGFRLSRLELLEAQMWLKIHEAGLQQQLIQGTAHTATIETSYYYSLYNLSKGTGIAPAFSRLDQPTIDKILSAKFYGSNYSDRIWKNTGKLAGDIKVILASATTTGQSHTKTTKLIKDRYNVKRWEAARLVRTETAHFNTTATTESYRNIGIDEWVFVATLDSHTDDICAGYDGQRFPVGDGPLPPIHPDCRCCQRAYLGQEYEPDERIMRDPITGKNRYIGNISYGQWRELYGL